jgi:hypothetical protein
MTISCSQCGSSFPDDFNFCLTCGKRLKEATSPPPAPAVTARPGVGAGDGSGRSASPQEELPALSLEEKDPTAITLVIDQDEYSVLVERVQALRNQVKGLARPVDFDPRRFFAAFDRVRLKPWHVPDFIFIPSPSIWPVAAETPVGMDGTFSLYTRLAFLPRRHPRALKPNGYLLPWGYARRPRLSGLIMEPSASGFLQFAMLGLEVQQWRQESVPHWTYASDWRWVCSSQHLETLTAALDAPSPLLAPFQARLTEQQRRWLRQVDPQLRVRMRGEQAQVGGLAYSCWDGFAWLDCELRRPHGFRISRLEKLGIGESSRVGMGMPVY